jgi:hypothetical protein
VHGPQLFTRRLYAATQLRGLSRCRSGPAQTRDAPFVAGNSPRTLRVSRHVRPCPQGDGRRGTVWDDGLSVAASLPATVLSCLQRGSRCAKPIIRSVRSKRSMQVANPVLGRRTGMSHAFASADHGRLRINGYRSGRPLGLS